LIKRSLIIALLFILGTEAVHAQKRKNRGKNDFKEVEAPPINFIKPDTTEVLFSESDLEPIEVIPETAELSESNAESGVILKKELSLVSEDTSTIDEGFAHFVEISEELKIDCVWVTSQEYFSIWDSHKVNPYNIDGEKFSDTISLALYDTINGYDWAFPIKNSHITSTFGMRSIRWHYGTDLELDTGDTVVAAFDGIVRVTEYDRRGYGHYVVLRHYNGLETLYGHLSAYKVKVGDLVKAGELIGLGGSTGRSSGPHLHYEVRYQGNAINPDDLYDFKSSALKVDTLLITPQNFSYLKEARKVVYHKIRSGDTLSGISRRYGVSINTITRLNGISRKTVLKIGRRLRIR
jgi:hypothetical protein